MRRCYDYEQCVRCRSEAEERGRGARRQAGATSFIFCSSSAMSDDEKRRTKTRRESADVVAESSRIKMARP